MQLNPTITVLTPLGEGIAYFMEDGVTGIEWQVFIKRTGESWWFRNPHIRLIPSATVGIGPVSDFTDLLVWQNQIDRYKQNRWI